MPAFDRRLSRASALALALAPALAAAPVAIGPAKCTGCHDHERQAAQWRTTEPAQAKGKAHVDALKRLDGPKAAAYAKAVGLADAYDLAGSCVKCHGSVFRGDANAGVSCESCHGPAGDYLEPHQQKGSYARAVSLGLRDLHQKPEAIGRLCAGCHRIEDRRLLAAGHADGAGWDAAASVRRITHWASALDVGRVAAAARARTAAEAPVAAAASAPVAAVKAGAAPRAADPWDWSQPVQALPANYQPAAAAPAPAAPVVAAPAIAAPAAALPPSIAEERPAVPVRGGPRAPAVVPVLVSTRSTVNPGAETAGSAGPVDLIARRGQALRALEALLRRGARVTTSEPPRPPAEFGGPDAELLRLQEEALVLALEALRRP